MMTKVVFKCERRLTMLHFAKTLSTCDQQVSCLCYRPLLYELILRWLMWTKFAQLFYWLTTRYPLMSVSSSSFTVVCVKRLFLILQPIINLLSVNISVNFHIISARLYGSFRKHQNSIEWGGSISTWLSMNIQWCWYDQSMLNIIYLEAYCD